MIKIEIFIRTNKQNLKTQKLIPDLYKEENSHFIARVHNCDLTRWAVVGGGAL
jgi:hypothetical protein